MTDGAFLGAPDPLRRPTTPSDAFPTPIEIARRAAELKVLGVDGPSADDYWKRAEDELLDRAARRATCQRPNR